MTEAELQVLQDARAACLASAEAIGAVLAGQTALTTTSRPLPSRDGYENIATMADIWGISLDGARRRAKLLHKRNPILATKLGAGRWLVHRSVLLPSASECFD